MKNESHNYETGSLVKKKYYQQLQDTLTDIKKTMWCNLTQRLMEEWHGMVCKGKTTFIIKYLRFTWQFLFGKFQLN